MASANINYSLLDTTTNFPRTYNMCPGPSLSNIVSEAELLNLQQELSINVFDNVDPPNSNVNEQQYPNSNVNEQQYPNSNENEQQYPNSNETSSTATQALSKLYGMNENMLQWSNENFSRVHINGMSIPEEQLTVNVDAEENGMHSWRPNVTDSLMSDIFVAQSDLDNAIQTKPPQLFLWDSPIGEESVPSKVEVEQDNSSSDGSTNCPHIDVQSYLVTQRLRLHCLQYEVINAKHKLHETQDVVEKLSCELEEKLLFKNSKEMKTLHDENAELRLECQCLCTEVDYYLSGKAPLGEVDENFWESLEENNKTDNTTSSQPPTTAEHQVYNSEEQEEANKWECPVCTFANHPAISSCEMCHEERVRKEAPQLHSTDICFCHPKQGSDCS